MPCILWKGRLHSVRGPGAQENTCRRTLKAVAQLEADEGCRARAQRVPRDDQPIPEKRQNSTMKSTISAHLQTDNSKKVSHRTATLLKSRRSPTRAFQEAPRPSPGEANIRSTKIGNTHPLASTCSLMMAPTASPCVSAPPDSSILCRSSSPPSSTCVHPQQPDKARVLAIALYKTNAYSTSCMQLSEHAHAPAMPA